jgi:eukaryotic-like serine/threonine-protein kinase
MASLEPGKRLAGRYVLLERLGDGGHAEVWAADDEIASVRIALKFMHLRSCTADEAMVVLRHEAQMAQRLAHPGVLRVGEPQRDGPTVFLPMEHADGGDVAQLRGASWRRLLPVLLQVARVLEHAHSRGVVHRDIKPGNVLFDGAGNVRVTDFGTASRTGSTLALSAGSPFFASPQQLRGDAATTSDDVYGLGALAYALLTRHPPNYPDFNPQQAQQQDPPRPVPAEAAPAVLLDLVHSMLAREGARRPDLRQVMLGFEQCMATDVEVPRTPLLKSRAVRVLAAATALGAVVFLVLWKGATAMREPRDVDDVARGAVFESHEQWQDAVAHYKVVLARDASLQFAEEGLGRSSRRAALDAELAGYLATPGLFATPAGHASALRALARAEATIPRTPRLAGQITQLRAALQMSASR